MKSRFKFSLIFILILFSSFALAEILVSDSGVTYDSKIESLFESQKWVHVSVNLNANISSNYSGSIKNREESEKYLEDIKSQVKEAQNKVLPLLSENEFRVRYVFELTPTFSGNITKEGFDKLVNNLDVNEIGLVERASVNDVIYSEKIGVEEEKVLDVIESEGSAKVIVGVASESIRDDVISSLLEDEFKLRSKSLLGLSFSGEITRKGFDKLINNPYVKWINLEISVGYEENKVEDDVLELLETNEFVSVVVKLNEINESLVESVSSSLSSEEFSLLRENLRGDGFYGNISKEGLEKLISNPNVKEIYLDRVASVNSVKDKKNVLLIVSIALLLLSTFLYYSTKIRFYKKGFASYRKNIDFNFKVKEIDVVNDFVEERFQLALFFPKIYFKKETFWKGYFLYLLSLLLMFAGFVFFYFWLKSGGN